MVVNTSPGVTRPGIYLSRTIQVDGFPRKIRVAGPWHATDVGSLDIGTR
jgi:hypothetical protein